MLMILLESYERPARCPHSQLGPVISGQDGQQGGVEDLTFWPRQVACRHRLRTCAAGIRTCRLVALRRHFLVSSQGPREPTLADHGGRTGGDPGMNDGFDRNGDLQAARASDAGALLYGVNQPNQKD